MSEFLTYKKISDLEEVEEVLSGATIPILDGDGVVKRISAEGIGGNSNNSSPVVFKVSQGYLYNFEEDRQITAKEVFDAYFSNQAYVEDEAGGTHVMPQKITGFYISGGTGGQVVANGYSHEFGSDLTNEEVADLAKTYY